MRYLLLSFLVLSAVALSSQQAIEVIDEPMPIVPIGRRPIKILPPGETTTAKPIPKK
jgi:hypothetical protein